MKSVGVDLHKKTITVCVMDETLAVLETRRFYCDQTALISAFFQRLGECQVAVEATARSTPNTGRMPAERAARTNLTAP